MLSSKNKLEGIASRITLYRAIQSDENFGKRPIMAFQSSLEIRWTFLPRKSVAWKKDLHNQIKYVVVAGIKSLV